jgi:hypothetical protein
MVNNGININKTNNHLLPQITEHKKTRRLTMEILVMIWEGYTMWRGNRFNRSIETQTTLSTKINLYMNINPVFFLSIQQYISY